MGWHIVRVSNRQVQASARNTPYHGRGFRVWISRCIQNIKEFTEKRFGFRVVTDASLRKWATRSIFEQRKD